MISDDAMAGADPTRLDRRQAMKAAIGGAAAAAALAAPRIEGFSIVPDFASAASQCPPNSQASATSSTTTNGTITKTSTGAVCVLTKCWGNNPSGCSCGTTPVPGTLTVAAASPNFTGPSITATVAGQVGQGGTLTLNVANFTANQPYATCAITARVTCSAGSPEVTFNGVTTNPEGTLNITSGGTYSGTIQCNGGFVPTGTVTLSATCICGPD